MSNSMITAPYLQDRDFLKALDEMSVTEIFVKITVLDKNEDIIEEIQGKASAGQLNVDGQSSLRRTGSLTFIPDVDEVNLMNAQNLISINKRIKLEIGYTNNLISQYPGYASFPIIWFPLGIYLITGASISRSTSDLSISIQIQDKMCLLNGTCGGIIPAATTLHSIETVDTYGDVIGTEYVTIYNIIREVVNHFGEESLNKIFVNDVSLRAKEVVQWMPSDSSILYQINTADPHIYEYTTTFTPDYVDSYVAGSNIGYRFTDFIYPGELVADAGQTVCDILDKIKDVLGNYEYFYDINGNFIFQEVKNYLNTSFSTIVINDIQNSDYFKNVRIQNRTAYDFNDNLLINSIASTPSYAQIKNDFVVWGIRTDAGGSTFPIRYHLVLDKKPIPTQKVDGRTEDWRNVFYRQGKAAEQTGIASNFYYPELNYEWEKLYDVDTLTWNQGALDDAASLDYYLDFIDTDYLLAELSVSNIGRRSKVITDNEVNCLFPPTIPNIVFFNIGDDPAEAINKQMFYAFIPAEISENLQIGVVYKDAFSVVRDFLYQYTSYNSSLTLQTIPIYYLDVNTRIGVHDSVTNINGDFMINSLSVPINIGDTMSISANAVLERI